MPQKIKVMQPEKFTGRDNFATPRYAVDLLIPFLSKNKFANIWEPACGKGNISHPLEEEGFSVYSTDIVSGYANDLADFLKDHNPYFEDSDCIVTNPPFSLKMKFVDQCFKYNIPWALLMPADFSSWMIKAMKRGAQRIVPERRIDYLTPNMLQNINDTFVLKTFAGYYTKKKDVPESLWTAEYANFSSRGLLYNDIRVVPVDILRKYTSNFHSIWLTWGLNLGAQEVYAELTNEMKNRIF